MDDKNIAKQPVLVQKDRSNVEMSNIQGTLQQSGNSVSHSLVSQKRVPKDSVETGQLQQHTSQLNSNQAHPKKKSGFVITSVKDSVDGDESADDLDESHASYSDVSYSRATDIDRDEGSSTSDETLNSASHEEIPVTSSTYNSSQTATNKSFLSRDHVKSTLDSSTQASVIGSVQDFKSHGEVTPSAKVELHQEIVCDVKSNSETSSSLLNTNTSTVTTNVNDQPVASASCQHSHPQTHSQVAASGKTVIGGSTNNAPTSTNVTKPSSSSNTTVKGASRVYKVVKRESLQPIRRDSLRWTCFDYGDIQSPNLGYIIPSTSDSRINFNDQIVNASAPLPLSLSATSVPSSASAYSLQHSDSTSSMHKEIHFVNSAASNVTVQHSASTSSVNYDADGLKLPKQSRPLNEVQENSVKNISGNERPGKSSSDHELTTNIMHSSGEMSNTVETEDESSTSTNVRIDNKIEAAMDLVKKHLMLAVRDEVDELKDKIVELQQEVDVMKGVLTPEQLAHIQSILNKSIKQPPVIPQSQHAPAQVFTGVKLSSGQIPSKQTQPQINRSTSHQSSTVNNQAIPQANVPSSQTQQAAQQIKVIRQQPNNSSSQSGHQSSQVVLQPAVASQQTIIQPVHNQQNHPAYQQTVHPQVPVDSAVSQGQPQAIQTSQQNVNRLAAHNISLPTQTLSRQHPQNHPVAANPIAPHHSMQSQLAGNNHNTVHSGTNGNHIVDKKPSKT